MNQKYQHLIAEERDELSRLFWQEVPIREIAKRLNRSPSTISRELARNGPASHRVYHARVAQLASERRNRRAHQRQRLICGRLQGYVIRKLRLGWSPELISGRLHRDHPEMAISHEAIYQFVYDPVIRQKYDLAHYLPRSHRKRCRRKSRSLEQKPRIWCRIGIEQRPYHILNREEFGHWESDAVVSRQSSATLNVSVERKSRYTKVTKMSRKTAHETQQAIVGALSRFPQIARKTITYDNGSENSAHLLTNHLLGTRSYFCNPYHSWERGTNENTIGLVRRVFPKKTDFEIVTRAQIRKLEYRLNNRPRKCLSYQTPSEVFRRCCT
jgi:IS30 family transposase